MNNMKDGGVESTPPSFMLHCNPLRGQNRVFPVYYFHTGKNLFLLAGIPVMKTGFSLMEILHRENPVFITGMGLQCVSSNQNSRNL